MPSPASSRPSLAVPIVLDAALIVLFAVIGRLSHGEEADAGGVATTAWPFLAGAAIGWLVSLAWRAPYAVVRAGIPIWICAVALGMVFRVLDGTGIEVSFVIVAAIVLGVFLLGWRALARPLLRRRGARGRA